MESLTQLEQLLRQTIRYIEEFTNSHQLNPEEYTTDNYYSAHNLLNYLAFRQLDVRKLQQQLAELGLNSLDCTEAHILPSLDAVLQAVLALQGCSAKRVDPDRFKAGTARLRTNSLNLLGPRPEHHHAHIMVTMPVEAASNPDMISNFLRSGMDLMRINCAHDSPEAWHRMIDHLESAKTALGKPCKVYIDLAGPKLRTGQLQTLGNILRIKPVKDPRGAVLHPASAKLTASHHSTGSGHIPVSLQLLEKLLPGDSVRLTDCRGRKRSLAVISVEPDYAIACCDRSVYFETGQKISLFRNSVLIEQATVGLLPEVFESISLHTGDLLDLLPPDHSGNTDPRIPAISCTMQEIFGAVKVGQPIHFDDGKITGRIETVSDDCIRVRITHTPNSGCHLQGDKGINLPNTCLPVSAITAKDSANLAALVNRVDLIGMSFVTRPRDIIQLSNMLKELNASDRGIVLKIETSAAFNNLCKLLLIGLKLPKLGVMVARGDLAAEIGFERLAEVQEEILWLCEAAHVPVIWATQVLENLAKKGAPSRAEISDTVMAGRAECVMLNKGENMHAAISLLADILTRMEAHQRKREARLRPLKVCNIPDDGSENGD